MCSVATVRWGPASAALKPVPSPATWLEVGILGPSWSSGLEMLAGPARAKAEGISRVFVRKATMSQPIERLSVSVQASLQCSIPLGRDGCEQGVQIWDVLKPEAQRKLVVGKHVCKGLDD